MNFPHVLVDQIASGRVVLVLGAGATRGAIHPTNAIPPDGAKLRDMLASKFLGPEFMKHSLEQVAAYAIGESSLAEVQNYIRDIFTLFDPAPFHKLVSSKAALFGKLRVQTGHGR